MHIYAYILEDCNIFEASSLVKDVFSIPHKQKEMFMLWNEMFQNISLKA